MDRWLVNGAPKTSISLEDRGFSYGDGLFETIAVRDGKCRFLDAHLKRLQAGCSRLGLNEQPTDTLATELIKAIANGTYGTAKIIITRGRGPRGYRPPANPEPTRIIGYQESVAVTPVLQGVQLRYCTTLISRNRQTAGLKSLNRLEQVLAQSEWNDPGIAEGLMLNDKGEVVCGTMTNLFCSRDKVLLTPNLSECGIKGVMRQQVIEVARAADITVTECAIDKRDLMHADDLFLTNSLSGLITVAELDGRRYSPSVLTTKIKQGLYALGVEECAA